LGAQCDSSDIFPGGGLALVFLVLALIFNTGMAAFLAAWGNLPSAISAGSMCWLSAVCWFV